MQIIVQQTYGQPAKSLTTGRSSTCLGKVIQHRKLLPGEVAVSPDGKTICKGQSSLYCRPKSQT